MKKIFDFDWGNITCEWNEKDKDAPSEMLCYDSIGKDPWTGGGISSSDFSKALNELPTDRDVHIKINSRGGDVHQGIAMRNTISQWKAKNSRKVVSIIDGVAASTASWAFPTVSDEVRAFRSSQVFCHEAVAFPGVAYADDLRKLADNLDKTSGQIADMYASKTGKRADTMRKMMKDETLMTGEEALEIGLVDKLIDGKAVRNFTPRELTNMSNLLSAMYNSAPKRDGNQNKIGDTMKKKLIAMLNKLGVTEWEGKPLNEETTEEHLNAALDSVSQKAAEIEAALAASKTKKPDPAPQPDNTLLADMQNQLKDLQELAKTQKSLRMGNELDKLITNDQLSASEKDKALARCIKDETYLDELKARPVNRPGGNPLRSIVELVGNSFNEVQGYLLENGPKFMRNFIGARADGNLGEKTCQEIRDRAIVVANTISKHKKMLVEMFNTNTIDAGLQRQIILQEMLEEFAIKLLPLQSFSTVFSNVPLEGTDEVDVPFYPLATDTGTSWDPSTGYATMGNTTTNTRPVVVGGSGTTSGSSAAANTAKDRKWVGASFSSYELARQPYLNVQKLMVQKANALAVAIFKDIVSRVITAGNFAASVKAVAAAQFSGDDVADLWESATGRNWPDRGRCLVLNHKYKTPLLKDPTFKQYLSYGATDPLRKAVIQEAYGFEDMPIVPNLDTYSPAGENLVGWINWMYAVLVATAPIMPTPEVRALMTRYDVIVHPSIGAAFEYRRFGDTTLDVTKEIVECSYGANKGVASALARITSQ